MLKLAAVGLCIALLLKVQTIFLGCDLSSTLLSIALVLFGPLLSILLAHPWKSVRQLWHETLHPQSCTPRQKEDLVEQIQRLTRTWHESGPRGLEMANLDTVHPLLRKGAGLLVDGFSGEDIRKILEKNFELSLSGKNARAAILSSLVNLTQSFGFVGTLIGLIMVLNSLGGKAEIGPGFSVAPLTTLYGLLFANFLFIPIHKRYLEKIREECDLFPLIAEGVQGIANRESATHISYKLNGFFDQKAIAPKSVANVADGVDLDLAATLADDRVFAS